jgi:hypothetical protein
MIQQALSRAATRSESVLKLPRNDGESNLAWLARAEQDMRELGKGEWTSVLLLGGTDSLSFRLRVAQSHLRRDLLPSFWSHSMLARKNGADWRDASLIDVPLIQPGGRAFSPRTNGVQEWATGELNDAERFVNIALIGLPIAAEKVYTALERFKRSRSTLDALEHVLRWLAFAWGVARTPNPLHDNYGLPSSCMLDTITAAADFDLTPGLESRASCPEAIWVAVLYWWNFYQENARRAPVARFSATHYYPITEPLDPLASAPAPRSPSAARKRAPKRTAKRSR